MKAVRSDSQTARFSGFALSTAMPVSETVEFMKSGKIEPMKLKEENLKILSKPIEEDGKSSNAHCVSYLIKDLSKVKKVDDLRQKLRMRGLRCHPMYCRNSTRLQVIPLLASRAQALRYLFVRWRLNVTNMYVILGETGDTDYEELRSGTHKTVIMKGIVEKGSDELLRKSGSYHRDDVIPGDSPRVAYTSGKQQPVTLQKRYSKLRNPRPECELVVYSFSAPF
ncbi:putative sucrose-phosphate synthase 2 [Vitis vinifera]|uniref:Putative sucrose-phosphate synthase 2 n=1 Tax=Vitis vinifera TaxID=29760 RepID=A0A438GV75_VITVI|nr:putative sucrose-phosphate synthase 2 [Vitis vinifera]